MLTDKPRSKSEKVATVDEISEAIEKLLPEEWGKLYAYAKNRARMMALYGAALDAEDLVQSAIIALLEQRRTWNPKRVTFTGVLMGAMKSIASNYKEKSHSVVPIKIRGARDSTQSKLLQRISLRRLGAKFETMRMTGVFPLSRYSRSLASHRYSKVEPAR